MCVAFLGDPVRSFTPFVLPATVLSVEATKLLGSYRIRSMALVRMICRV
jgi:hypothetical protein